MPVQAQPDNQVTAKAFVQPSTPIQSEAIVREEVRKWISENMPQLVEKLVKDELFKLTKGSA